MTEWRQKGRRGAVPYEVNAIFGRPMITPTTPHKKRATDDRPYEQCLPRFLELNALSPTK